VDDAIQVFNILLHVATGIISYWFAARWKSKNDESEENKTNPLTITPQEPQEVQEEHKSSED